MTRDRPHDDAMAELLREDAELAIELLNGILLDGEPGELVIALRQLTKAYGGAADVAKRANLSPARFEHILSYGNPGFEDFSAILGVMGLRLSIRKVRDPDISDIEKKSHRKTDFELNDV